MLYFNQMFGQNVLINCKQLLSVRSRVISYANSALPCSECDKRLLKFSVIGVPNSGKSTFINCLMGKNLCATSSKVHTTRHKERAILTLDNTQLVFFDTPGLVNSRECKKHKLEKSFMHDSSYSIKEADIVGVIHDVSNVYTRERLDTKVIHLLSEYKDKPSFLVLNKTDLMKSKRKILDIVRLLTDNCLSGEKACEIEENIPPDRDVKVWRNFQDIFMVSALTGDGLDDVRNYLVSKSKPSNWIYPEDMFTDQKSENIIVNIVKAKLLGFLPKEIPYLLKPEIEYFAVNERGVITTIVLIHCPSKRLANLIAGEGDGRLRQITQHVQKDLQDIFMNFVKISLKLIYKSEK